MSGLIEQHDHKKVSGGPMEGKLFHELDLVQLKRAARKYPSDHTLQKYAKSKVAMLELADPADPEPCAPLRIVAKAEQSNPVLCKEACVHFAKKWFFVCISNKWIRYVLVLACTLMILRPPVSTLVTKSMVRWLRLALRRSLEVIWLLFEGLLDEMVYQIDHMLRASLPTEAELREIPTVAAHLITHLFSASLGVAGSLFASYMQARRGQVAG